ncbi:MAG: hypothetical protein EPN79_11065 [Burkholderiaceae bacterium]|nr:MAG: hypothetical protein EPN79_11065 [Burkholderiaceae bacterium]TBR76776.1 MAG: hypothetical protein EPN64_06010 [Burkholderiaceae bacterium]
MVDTISDGARHSAYAIVREVAAKRSISPEFASEFFKTCITAIMDCAMTEGTCWIPGVGSFKRVHFSERVRFNPHTKTTQTVPAGVKISFILSKPRKEKKPAAHKEEKVISRATRSPKNS